MKQTPPVGIVFVHGISNGREAREGMRERFCTHLRNFNVPFEDQYVSAAIWRSSGRFDYDLDILYRVDGLRMDAIDDVAQGIMTMHDKLPANGRLLIVPHSMGQVLAYCAADMLSESGQLTKPYSMLSLGGPLGNTNPVYRSYLSFARRRGPLTKAVEWYDVYNTDDPICANLATPEKILDIFVPRVPKEIISNIFKQMGEVIKVGDDTQGLGLAYQSFENSIPFEITYPGGFIPSDPMREHSSYFKAAVCFDLLKKMRTKLVGQ